MKGIGKRKRKFDGPENAKRYPQVELTAQEPAEDVVAPAWRGGMLVKSHLGNQVSNLSAALVMVVEVQLSQISGTLKLTQSLHE